MNLSKEKKHEQRDRSASPKPSCVSMKSGDSMDHPCNFREGDSPTDPVQSLFQRDRSVSPKPSCVSMKSGDSMDHPCNFREEDSPTEPVQSLIPRDRSVSPKPSCVSMKSGDSMDHPCNFREEDSPTELMQSDQAKKIHSQNLLEQILKEMEQNVFLLMKNEMMIFRKLLCPDYSACSKRETEDEVDHSSIRDEALKITLHVLRNMDQGNLADMLKTKLISVYQEKHKYTIKKKVQRVNEGISKKGYSVLLNEIYTELYITEGGSGEVNNEHEVRQLETASRRSETQEAPISCNDIFKPLPGQDKSIRTVLTKGVAGIGKTVSVQKFILDWAEGKANQDVHFIFPLPFRELNLMKDKPFNLISLLHHFAPETKELRLTDFVDYNILFIFDGLDECRLPLDFQNNMSLSDMTETASVDVLLTNLIRKNMLPSALLWITSRPAACGQIPPECVDQVTEVQGFSDPQKEEYFRKRISDQSLANRMITHMKSSRSLYIMCHIPVFCWISATVLMRMLHEAESTEFPKTLTHMFAHFLIFQIKQSKQKYQEEGDTDQDQTTKIVWTLGKLAFQQLEKGNLIFHEEDLRKCGIDVREVSVYSGLCTQIFREEYGLHMGKVYSFVHLSIQEFLAALFVFLSFISNQFLDLQTTYLCDLNIRTMTDFLNCVIDKALESKNGHLDLFLRFLLGLSLESNQTILQDLLPQTGSSQLHEGSSHEETPAKYIKKKIKENLSPEKTINLFYCLNELNDHSLMQDVQTYLHREGDRCIHEARLSPAQWSALAFMLLNSKEDLDQFRISKYIRSEECFLRLLPVVKASKKAELRGSNLTGKSCAVLASALSSSTSCLKELDLSYNILEVSRVKLLSAGLGNSHCKLETLGLYNCGITEEGSAALVSALKSNPSYLRELNLGWNKPKDFGVNLLSALLADSNCKLEKLKLWNCGITEKGCADLASALKSNPSHLRELDLGYNELCDSGVKKLCAALEDPQTEIKKVVLYNCNITEESCAALASALKSNPSHLSELDLGKNKIKDSGVKLLSDLLQDQLCKLEKLQLNDCSVTEEGCIALISALKSNPSQLRELSLNYNTPGESGVRQLSDLLEDPHCKLETIKLDNCNITEKGCTALASALKLNPSSSLRELILNHNKPGESGVKLLCDLLKGPKLETLELYNCNITEHSCAVLASAVRLNPSYLRKLNLNWNEPRDVNTKLLSALLKSPEDTKVGLFKK